MINKMSKKKFLQLIRLASQPLPSKEKKSAPADGYTEKQTPQHKN